MKDLKDEYPILKEDEYHRKMKKKNKNLFFDVINGLFNVILKLLLR